jgi:Family of unknown function (DUF5681)
MSSNDDGGSKPGPNPKPPGDYEVGYGRPPREHRFKKGEPSRNPNGRPRGVCRAAPDLGAALLQPTKIRIQGKVCKVAYLEAMILVMKDMALRGDHRAAQMLINLTRELDLIRPKEEFKPPSIHIHFVEPGEKINE